MINSLVRGVVLEVGEDAGNLDVTGDLSVGGLVAVIGALTAATVNGQVIDGGTVNAGAVHWCTIGGEIFAFGAADPSAAGGVALAAPATYFRTSNGDVYTKTGGGATAWGRAARAADAAGGDATGTLAALTVASVGGQLAAAIASGAVAGTAAKAVTDAATSANTASTVVKRGAGGEISVGKITVTLSTFVNNAAALIGGLAVGDVYQTAAGVLLVVV